ncbi:baseplate assembly protein [Sphingomonas sp. LT1P40]|uniref:baseplate assembly protein n=1 Tax=Alteristakelama amylovorans TaxID=3096166 RepID=UPI002FC5D010
MTEASSSTAIDLSRLPAPSFVAPRSYDAIRAEQVAMLQELIPEFDATIASDPAVKLLDVFAYREQLLTDFYNQRALQVMLAYSTGADLDQLGANVNVERLVLEEGDLDTDPVYESDADFRRRIQLAPESFSVAGPDTAYRFHALSADASIADASATSPSPGHVLISLLSRVGDGTASADQIEAVEDIVTNRAVRPLTDMVSVASVELLPFVVLAALTLFHGPDRVVVLAAAEARLAAYIAAARKIGRPVTRSGIIAALHVEGVLNVALTHPAADVMASDAQVAHCTGADVTIADD